MSDGLDDTIFPKVAFFDTRTVGIDCCSLVFTLISVRRSCLRRANPGN